MIKLQNRGINAASVTYDGGDVLAAFSKAYKIGYPMLSDQGSNVIRAFGILNTNIPNDHPFMQGIPWPGEYLVAPDGTVLDKVFVPSYEFRRTASEIVLRNFGAGVGDNSVSIQTGAFTAAISLSSDRCFPGQELGVILDIHMNPGWHIYGKPLPEYYRAVELQFSGDLVGNQRMDFPEPKTKLMPALDETLSVYEEHLRASGTLGIRWSPPMPAPFLKPLAKTIAPGKHKVIGTLRFQACSETACEPPDEIAVELPLSINEGVPPPPKAT